MSSLLKKIWGKAKSAVRQMKSKFDKEGSYTGSPDTEKDSRPEQDADDL